MQKNILITGRPKSGKSTLLHSLIGGIAHKVGLLAVEVLENGQRTGFAVETSAGQRALLASTGLKTPLQVSKYHVDVAGLESVLPHISHFPPEALLYLDEIGQMQLFSQRFKDLVCAYLDAPNICLATLSFVYEDDFTRSIKERDDIILIEISPEGREAKAAFISQLLKKIEKAKGYVCQPERLTVQGSLAELRSEHGTRQLSLVDGKWSCSCDFYGQYRICSHAIAVAEMTRDR